MTSLKLTDVEYGQFRIGDIFEIENCKCSKVSELVRGKIPYVGATNRNNGVLSFVDAEIDLITKGNCIAFICDGEGSVGYSIYKGEDFVGSTTIKVGRNPKLNRYNGLFITTVADTVRGKYNFGYKRNETHLKAETLQLPIDLNGNPNWIFMEEYIKQEQKKQAQKIVNYYKQRIIECDFKLLDLEDTEWKEFYLTELFDIKRGNQNNMGVCKDGDIPLVSARKVDNGYKAFISDNGKELFENNILTLNNDGDGGVGLAFYQPHYMALDTHVTALIPKHPTDKYSQLFLSRAITNQREKFSHGYSINNSRLQKQKIMLPVDKNGNPHWEYMCVFTRKIESEKISKILGYLINTYLT